jgi:hypothetical protein
MVDAPKYYFLKLSDYFRVIVVITTVKIAICTIQKS